MSNTVEVESPQIVIADDKLLTESNTLFDEVLGRVIQSIRFKKLTVTDLMYISTDAMQIISKYPQFTGEDKKRMVIEVVYTIVDKSDVFQGETEQKALEWIKNELPKFIDLMYGAWAHAYDFAKVQVAKCKAGCIPRREKK